MASSTVFQCSFEGFPKSIQDFNYHLGVGDELELRRIKSSEKRIASNENTNGASTEIKGLEKTQQVVISSQLM